MKRLSLVLSILALATPVLAQNTRSNRAPAGRPGPNPNPRVNSRPNPNIVTRSYATVDAYGNVSRTTIQAPRSVAGLIANAPFLPSVATGLAPAANPYGNSTYYNGYYPPTGYYPPAGYYPSGGYAPYYYPGYSVPINNGGGPFPPATVTVTPSYGGFYTAPCPPNYGYYGAYPSYGYSSSSYGISVGRGGLNVNIGSTTVNR